MNTWRRYVVALLVAVLPVSAAASLLSPCAGGAANAPQNAVASNPHAHHQPTDQAPDVSGAATAHAGHAQAAAGGHAAHGDCPCCSGDCGAVCAHLGCSFIAVPGAIALAMFSAAAKRAAFVEPRPRGPSLATLFRPPILA